MTTTTLGIRPSLPALRRAAAMGREMARREPTCVADLRNAGQYESYIRFRNVTRERLEQSRSFTHDWSERLFKLAAKEASACGLRMDDSMASWDLWYNRLVSPLKDVFWQAWETTWDLPARYAQARRAAMDALEPPPLLPIAVMRPDADVPAPGPDLPAGFGEPHNVTASAVQN